MAELDQGAAQRAIGVGDPNDIGLQPQKHAEGLASEAGGLARVLTRKTIAPVVSRFLEHDAAAIRCQRWRARLGVSGVYLRLAPVIIGAVLLLLSLNVLSTYDILAAWLRAGRLSNAAQAMNFLMFLQFLSLFLAAVTNWTLSVGRYFERWMSHRSAAETARLEYFYKIAGAREPQEPDEIPLLELQLEYFRRYQIDLQRNYYRRRAREHAVAAGRTRGAIAANTLLIVVSLIPAAYGAAQLFAPELLSQVLGQQLDAKTELAFVAIGIVAAGIGGAAHEISQLNLHQRNAVRFKLIADDLDAFSDLPLHAAREAARKGDYDTVAFFVDTVQGVVSSENQEWIQLWRLRQTLQLGRE